MPDSQPSSSSDYDVAIVGGGPAGLSAALWLARYLHSVVVIDSGEPRNWETRGINGFLGSQGIKSPALRRCGRTDAEGFGAKFIKTTVSKVVNTNSEQFVLTLEKGGTITARRVLLAFGIKDEWPRIPGLRVCYGETVHVCPDCDGYETRDKKTVVIGKGRKAVGMALSLTTWTEDIVICTNGEPAEIDKAQLEQLKSLDIPVLEESVLRVNSDKGEIRSVDLDTGMQLDCERLYFAISQRPADDLGVQLKCERDEHGLIVIDDRYHTSVMNVFAAGDIVPGPQIAVAAAAGGAIAAMAIHRSLVPDKHKLD